jgi:hypothetical protein
MKIYTEIALPSDLASAFKSAFIETQFFPAQDSIHRQAVLCHRVLRRVQGPMLFNFLRPYFIMLLINCSVCPLHALPA